MAPYERTIVRTGNLEYIIEVRDPKDHPDFYNIVAEAVKREEPAVISLADGDKRYYIQQIHFRVRQII